MCLLCFWHRRCLTIKNLQGNKMSNSVLIVGAGQGLSASLARQCAHDGMSVALAARNIDKLEDLAGETNASLHKCLSLIHI